MGKKNKFVKYQIINFSPGQVRNSKVRKWESSRNDVNTVGSFIHNIQIPDEVHLLPRQEFPGDLNPDTWNSDIFSP